MFVKNVPHISLQISYALRTLKVKSWYWQEVAWDPSLLNIDSSQNRDRVIFLPYVIYGVKVLARHIFLC